MAAPSSLKTGILNRSARASATHEFEASTANGYVMSAVALALLGAGTWLFVQGAMAAAPQIGWSITLFILGALTLRGLYILQPNQAALLLLFGNYRGTDRNAGLRWAIPFYSRTHVSLRVHNLDSDKIKVNDKRGNPIEIGAAIVWRVDDTARAKFDVEDYEAYVRVQSEAAIRHLASGYAYDEGDDPAPGHTEITLRSGIDEVRLVGAAGRGARRRAQGLHGEQPAGRAVRGERSAAGDQRRHALHLNAHALPATRGEP
jgi:hypothetical protein